MSDCEVSLMMKDLAKRKSFHVEMNEKTLVATRPGKTSGKRICHRNRVRLAPSMYGGLLQRLRDGLHKAPQHPDRERQREGDVRQDQRSPVC